MAGKNTLEFTDSNFDTDVLAADQPVLVDFWAEWCGPCRMIAPTVEAFADEYEGKIKVGKVNVDENNGTAARFNIRGTSHLAALQGRQSRGPARGRCGQDRTREDGGAARRIKRHPPSVGAGRPGFDLAAVFFA